MSPTVRRIAANLLLPAAMLLPLASPPAPSLTAAMNTCWFFEPCYQHNKHPDIQRTDRDCWIFCGDNWEQLPTPEENAKKDDTRGCWFACGNDDEPPNLDLGGDAPGDGGNYPPAADCPQNPMPGSRCAR